MHYNHRQIQMILIVVCLLLLVIGLAAFGAQHGVNAPIGA
jgi:hypothetical protein